MPAINPLLGPNGQDQFVGANGAYGAFSGGNPTLPNFGNLWTTANTNYNAMSFNDRAKLSGYINGGADEGGQNIWHTQGSDGLARVQNNSDAGESADQFVNKNTRFNSKDFFNQQGIIPIDPTWTGDGATPDSARMSPTDAQAWRDNWARSFNQFGAKFNNFDDYLKHTTGSGQYVDDATLGKIWVPDNRNFQTWNNDAMISSANQGSAIDRAVQGFANNGGLVKALGGAVAGAGAFDIFNGGADSLFGGGGFGSAGGEVSDAAGGGSGSDLYPEGGSNPIGGFDNPQAATGGGTSLGNLPTPPTGGGGSTTTAPAGTDAAGNLVDSNGTPYGPPSSSTAGGTVADKTYIPGAETGGGTGTAARNSALSRILDGTATTQDWLSLAGTAGTTLAGILGSDASRSANNSAADKMLNLGAPARAAFNATLAPGYDPSTMPGYQGAIDSVMNSYLRKASTGGNPFTNPGVSMEANRYVTDSTALPALNNYRNTLVNAGNTGIAGSYGPNAAAANSPNQTTNAVTGGLGALSANSPTDYSQILRQVLNLGSKVI